MITKIITKSMIKTVKDKTDNQDSLFLFLLSHFSVPFFGVSFFIKQNLISSYLLLFAIIPQYLQTINPIFFHISGLFQPIKNLEIIQK